MSCNTTKQLDIANKLFLRYRNSIIPNNPQEIYLSTQITLIIVDIEDIVIKKAEVLKFDEIVDSHKLNKV